MSNFVSNGPDRSRTQSGRPRRFFAALVLTVALAAVMSLTVSGCSPFYVIRAAYEEGKILWRRQPIERILENPDLDAVTKEKLRLVLTVREYARDTVKLNVGGSYASHSYVDRSVLSYILMAASKTELSPYTWWYLLVGRVPYKGFFSKETVEAEAERFQADGFDTYIRTTAAFSTLGWFDDPLLAHLLKYDAVTLAELIFHELLHNTLYVKSAGDFNESFANFVGNRAAIDFFRERSGEGSAEHRRAVQSWQEELEFSEFIEGVGGALRELYAKDIPETDKLQLREEIFGRSREDWRQRTASRPGHRFRGFAEQRLNNAVMIHYLVYLRELRLFESLYQAEGQSLVRVIETVREPVQAGGDPFEAVRALLNRS